MNDSRGQSGLDRLLGFVLVVAVLVALLPTILGFVGVDVRPDDLPGTEPETTPTPEPATLQVLAGSGNTTEKGIESVGVVQLTVTKVGSRDSIDLANASVTWVGTEKVYYLAPTGKSNLNTNRRFAVSVTHVGSGGETVLNQTGDRATLTFDLGTDDVADLPEFGERLRPGDTVEIQFSTGEGTTTNHTITVPPLGDKTVVSL